VKSLISADNQHAVTCTDWTPQPRSHPWHSQYTITYTYTVAWRNCWTTNSWNPI